MDLLHFKTLCPNSGPNSILIYLPVLLTTKGPPRGTDRTGVILLAPVTLTYGRGYGKQILNAY